MLFIVASAGWGILFLTDTLQMWHAMVLLVIHGCAGVLWQTSNQMLLYDIVGPAAAERGTAQRDGALSRHAGRAGRRRRHHADARPTHGIILNTLFYLPLLVWLFGRRTRPDAAPRRNPVRGIGDIMQTIRDIRTQPVLTSMIILAGLTSFMIGNTYQAQMPAFASDLGHGDPGVAYSVLLAADAAGALLAGVALEATGRLATDAAESPHAGHPVGSARVRLLRFTRFRSPFLFAAGFFELSFNTIAQAIVQMNAPAESAAAFSASSTWPGSAYGPSAASPSASSAPQRHAHVARAFGRRAIGLPVRPEPPRSKKKADSRRIQPGRTSLVACQKKKPPPLGGTFFYALVISTLVSARD